MRILNPATGESIRELETDDLASITDKARRARAAQRTWRQTPYADRAKAIQRFAELITEREDELAKTLTLEVGKPITQSRNELRALGGRIQFFLERTEAELADEILLTKEQGGTEERIRHEPLGVVANISAWNYPYFVGTNVFVPALLTGNTVLYKPSELSTLTGLSIERALHDAGIPKDAFITVIGAGEAGKALCESDIDGMFFTGSHATGARIARAVSERMIRVQLELGGKDPAYVTDDVDVASAAAAVADGAFYNTGQSCCAVERIYVHAGIWNAFLAEFEKTVKGFVLGDPLSENTYIGALARREPQIELLERQVSDAVTKGAKVLCGGKRIPGPGFFFEPTVLIDVTHDMQVMKDESFGPIIGIAKVGSDEEARDKMNDTEYGLTAAVYTANRERGERILAELDVGTAYVNCCDRVSPRLPWSGRRHSGVGATLSTYGIEAFTRPKAYHVR